MKGEKNGKYKGGIAINDCGYPRISAGPFRGKYLHKLIYEWVHPGEPPLGAGEDVHHVDDNKLNFHPSNLERRPKSEHVAAHNAKRKALDNVPF